MRDVSKKSQTLQVRGPDQKLIWIDIMADARRYWAALLQSPHLTQERIHELQRWGLPTIKVRRTSKWGYSGRAISDWTGRRIILSFGGDVDVAEARMVLLHELAHLACPANVHHDMPWRLVYRDAAKALWGLDITIPRHRYRLDGLIVACLRTLWGIPVGKPSWVELCHVTPEKVARMLPNIEQVAA